MTHLSRWLAVSLVAVLAAAGWLGWQQMHWRQLYFADLTGQVVYDVDMARRALGRAAETGDYAQKREAMSNAESYIESAFTASIALLDRLAPSRIGRPVYAPTMYVPAVYQYVRQLTPDLPDPAVKQRIELLDGLEKALKAGQTATWVPPAQAYRVDVPKLKRSLDEFFRSMPGGDEPGQMLHFADEPNRPTLTAIRRGDSQVELQVEWAQTWKLFPLDSPGHFLLVRPGAGAVVTSGATDQPQMGGGLLAPCDRVGWTPELHAGFKARLPAEWEEGSYLVIRIPEGLAQTLTIRVPAGAQPNLWFLPLDSGEPAAPIPLKS